MKLKLINGGVTTIQLKPLGGAYDSEEQAVIIPVSGPDGSNGTLSIPVNELRVFKQAIAGEPNNPAIA